MNLINDPWIPIVRADGTKERIAPWQIAEKENPAIEIQASRPDFQGALYQFLIGLLQTAIAPEDSDVWEELWRGQPDPEFLKSSFLPFVPAFELINANGPAFLQDFDMSDGETKSIVSLLIEAPGEKTLKDNLDHFVKGDNIHGVCEGCAAVALFTLQTNAPSGGQGHRVGLRGGGPLTTLLIPTCESSNLWKKLWVNVLNQDELHKSVHSPSADVFPWLAPTRTSDKAGSATLPEDVHQLQMYWGVPRRIRFELGNSGGKCNLCGDYCLILVTHYRTKNYGTNYEGNWVHPLTPYRFDPNHKKPPISLKGRQGGLGYRDWLSLALWSEVSSDKVAFNVRSFHIEKRAAAEIEASLRCFGYDMDNMKARCWYEHRLPVLFVSEGYRELFYQFVQELIEAAKDVVKELRSQVKAAWFSRPKDAKGDTSMVDQSFWELTELEFYQQLEILKGQSPDTRHMPPEVAKAWLSVIKKNAFSLFDYWALDGDAEDMDIKRIVKARHFLDVNMAKLKSLKNLKQISNDNVEVTIQ